MEGLINVGSFIDILAAALRRRDLAAGAETCPGIYGAFLLELMLPMSSVTVSGDDGCVERERV